MNGSLQGTLLAFVILLSQTPGKASAQVHSAPWSADSSRLAQLQPPEFGIAPNVEFADAPSIPPSGDWARNPYTCPEGCRVSPCDCEDDGGFFLGVEFLLIRPHFSEAIAFAQGSQAAPPPALSTSLEAQALDFDYEASPRASVGYRFGGNNGEVRLTWWHFRGDTSVDGGLSAPGQFIVDPFGNVVGSVIGPGGAVITGGDRIETMAWTETDVFDLEFLKPVLARNSRWQLSWSAGARIARVDQYYESLITNADGSLFSFGDFSVDFLGAGPRLGLEGHCHFDQERRFAAFAKWNGSLLVGRHEVQSGFTSTAPPVPVVATQAESMTRTIPVIETELGTSWQVSDSISLSAGWLFQAWFDMGTSGGTFGGLFAGADDANIMSFDGLFLRGEFGF